MRKLPLPETSKEFVFTFDRFIDNITKLMTYLGINNRELVLNKLQQLYYCHNELFKEMQKQV